MSRRIMLIPVGTSVGLTTVSMGLVRAIEEQGIKLNFFKPVAQPRKGDNGDNGEERSTAIIAHHASVSPITPFELEYVERMISNDSTDELLEEIIERFEESSVQEAVTSDYSQRLMAFFKARNSALSSHILSNEVTAAK